jgi:hypothetical protein
VTKQISALSIAMAMLLVPLAGCEHSLVAQNMGNAFRENTNAQIADPEAGRANEPGPQGLDGLTGEDVMGRYHKAQGGARTPQLPAIVTTGGSR